jgi:hypothetical protein
MSSDTSTPREYFVVIDGDKSGPHDLATLEAMAKAGGLAPEMLCWAAGWADWKAVSDVPDLAALLTADGPPPVPDAAPTPPPIPAAAPVGDGAPAGVVGVCHQIVYWLFRPFRGKPSRVRAYVDEKPVRAVGIVAGLAALVVVCLSLAFTPMGDEKDTSDRQDSQQQAGGGDMGAAQDNLRQARDMYYMNTQHNRDMDNIINDGYEYRRDS